MPLTTKNIVSDLIGGAGSMITYNGDGIPNYVKIDRVFQIEGLNQYSSKATAMSDALLLIQTLYPVASLCPSNPIAKARGYQVQPINSDDAVNVILSYIYSDIPVDPTQWIIEVDDFSEVVTTDAEYDPSNPTPTLIPIGVWYMPDWQIGQTTPPKPSPALDAMGNPIIIPPSFTDGKPNEIYGNLPLISYATAQVYRPRKRLVFTRTVYDPVQASAIEAAGDLYEGTLNVSTFRGRPQGSWLCKSVSIIYQPFASSNLVRLEFIARPSIEGWQPWVRYNDPFTGRATPNIFRLQNGGTATVPPPPTNGVDPNTGLNLVVLPPPANVTPSPFAGKILQNPQGGNGIRQANEYLYTDFNQLLALLPGGVAGTSPSPSGPTSVLNPQLGP